MFKTEKYRYYTLIDDEKTTIDSQYLECIFNRQSYKKETKAI